MHALTALSNMQRDPTEQVWIVNGDGVVVNPKTGTGRIHLNGNGSDYAVSEHYCGYCARYHGDGDGPCIHKQILSGALELMYAPDNDLAEMLEWSEHQENRRLAQAGVL